MGQAAYDYNTARRRKVPQTQRKTALRVEKGGKRRLSPLQAALRNAMHLVAAALLTGFAISLLMSEAQLVELNDQIQDAKAQLVSAQSQYLLQQHPEQQDQHHQRGRSGQPSGSDEDRPQPDHLHPAERVRCAGASAVPCAAVDQLHLQRCCDHSGHRKITSKRESVRQRTLFRFLAGPGQPPRGPIS